MDEKTILLNSWKMKNRNFQHQFTLSSDKNYRTEEQQQRNLNFSGAINLNTPPTRTESGLNYRFEFSKLRL